MGCDIHFYVEKKKAHGWECQDIMSKHEGYFQLFSQFGDGRFTEKKRPPIRFSATKWNKLEPNHPRLHQQYTQRNYVLFSVLANVRNDPPALPFIDELRGIPDDASGEIQECYERWGQDAHSETWLTLDEILNWEHWDDPVRDDIRPTMNTIKKQCKDFWQITVQQLIKLANGKPETVRCIYWFDN